MATTVGATTKQSSTVTAGSPPETPWYRDRTRQLVAGCVGILLIALVVWSVVVSGQRKERFAARSLEKAREAAEAGNLPLASSELQKLIQTYQGTDAATEAVITLNQVRMVNEQSELAAIGLRDFLATKPAPRYAAPAAGLLGAALENSRKWADAGKAYAQASQVADVAYLKARYLIDAGRAYTVAGDTASAVEAYRAIVEKYPTSTSFTEAQVRLAELTGGKM